MGVPLGGEGKKGGEKIGYTKTEPKLSGRRI